MEETPTGTVKHSGLPSVIVIRKYTVRAGVAGYRQYTGC